MQKIKFHFLIIFAWMIVTITLASWWLYFIMTGVQNWVDQPPTLEQSLTYKFMLKQEGIFLIVMLLFGGAGLLYHAWAVENEKERVKKFFMFFTHDLKTALTRLRLQTELIEEGGSQDELSQRIHHVQEEVVGLQVQLENALWMSRDFNVQTVYENRRFIDFIESLKLDWPGITFDISLNTGQLESFKIDIDRRLFQNIFQNLIQNSWVHGEATKVYLQIELIEGTVQLKYFDNGHGFKGSIEEVGQLYSRATPKSGTGIGLHVIRESVKKMNGVVEFKKENDAFICVLKIPQIQMNKNQSISKSGVYHGSR